MTDIEQELEEQVESEAERIADFSVDTLERCHIHTEFPGLHVLQVKAEVTLRGNVSGGITLVLAMGGPHIEFDASNRRVNGRWGSHEATAMVSDREVCDAIESHYWRDFEEFVLA